MILGLNFGAWIFWANLLVLVGGLGVIAGARRTTLICALGLAANAAGAALLWAVQGSCVLPQPTTVEYQQGMTLCPGQSATTRKRSL